MTPKEKQRELIIEIMKADEQSGLYDEPIMKQTAVEWYFTELWNAPKDKFVWHSILEKAKEMEKEQMKDAFLNIEYYTPFDSHLAFEEYYKEVYESE